MLYEMVAEIRRGLVDDIVAPDGAESSAISVKSGFPKRSQMQESTKIPIPETKPDRRGGGA